MIVSLRKRSKKQWQFLILKRAETESYGDYWGFMTGGKNDNETVAQVVVRELKEETSLTPQSIWATEYLVQFYEPEYDSIWILPLIVAVIDPEDKVKLSAENSEYRWLHAEKAKHLVSWKNLVRSIDDVAGELEIFPARNWVQIFAE